MPFSLLLFFHHRLAAAPVAVPYLILVRSMWRYVAVAASLLCYGCDQPRRSMSPAEYGEGSMGDRLQRDVSLIEASVPNGWRDFSGTCEGLDAAKGENFDVACSYLVRRDPTLFLRRFLAGDPSAICCGRAAYKNLQYRHVLDQVYRWRLLEASSEKERQKIRHFIAETTRKT